MCNSVPVRLAHTSCAYSSPCNNMIPLFLLVCASYMHYPIMKSTTRSGTLPSGACASASAGVQQHVHMLCMYIQHLSGALLGSIAHPIDMPRVLLTEQATGSCGLNAAPHVHAKQSDDVHAAVQGCITMSTYAVEPLARCCENTCCRSFVTEAYAALDTAISTPCGNKRLVNLCHAHCRQPVVVLWRSMHQLCGSKMQGLTKVRSVTHSCLGCACIVFHRATLVDTPPLHCAERHASTRCLSGYGVPIQEKHAPR
jgi:hypothetical protein